MIYSKKANFPYPVLMNFSYDYKEAEFEFDVTLTDNPEYYFLNIEWSLSSKFIVEEMQIGRVSLVLIIKSKDNQFHILPFDNKIHKKIHKSRLSLNERTVMQLMLLANDDICFENNMDLNVFYLNSRKDIIIHAGQVLGFSNIVVFDGSQAKPYELFEKRVDGSIESDIEIKIGEESIMIIYKNADLQFSDLPWGKELNYPYIYLGLQKALCSFLIHLSSDSPEDGIQINEMDPPENVLESKLYSLMQAKNIDELTWDNIDQVIYEISDNMVGRYTDIIRRLSNGD